ncbi:Asp-tRNA(Asn)/Glu-tRNA(Gln) amidotransferase subunit GatA [Acetobacterium woodii]|uniref:Glutamyl-tRNA(Gln) amidotransferase subunit A n=1 Tax=Acetobacterium woodii (strain ATCC 29683 / DSM 1030 / JCM 2381 / KCTC 1655 / WB1) TaxID=931626 RepID=H6LGH2_ACEWD|nr:Asp-tRNA(Asn)/Glu-tRNA(Gln) amidotransferase subunit GatA [Acetobacterium woodii]AFA47108.1 aspartyl/glutamyl-tRNA amidotransferase subunit A2 [Acetobacterium woodii DSM 1030]
MELSQKTIHEINDLLDKKEVTVTEVTQAVVNRINSVEKATDAYLSLQTEAALETAKTLDSELSKRDKKSPLEGIPYGLKDNMCTKGILTTCASKMLNNFNPPYNAQVYDCLTEAGGILLGKTNLDEFAMGSSTENSAYKVTHNPWNLNKVPGGSSGGSAVAVAADSAYFALGSDTGGSIRQPASFCGVVGMKPTYGLVSRYGLVAFASSLDQIGPFTKDVEDCALVLNAIVGHDAKDSTSLKLAKIDYTQNLQQGVKGLKVGVAKEFFGEGLQPEVRQKLEDAIAIYKALGAEIVDVSFQHLDYALSAYYMISSAEASSNLARYDGIRYGFRAEEYSDLVDLYKKTRSQGFGAEVKRRIMLGTYALSSGYYDAYYKKAMQVRTIIKEDFDQAFAGCDVLLTPTAPTTAFGIGEKTSSPLEMYLTDIYTVPVNIAGIPGVSIPCGLDNSGMPIGMQLLGPILSEETLLKVAWAFENESGLKNLKAPLETEV